MAWHKIKADGSRDIHINLDKVSAVEIEHRMSDIKVHVEGYCIVGKVSDKEIAKLEEAINAKKS